MAEFNQTSYRFVKRENSEFEDELDVFIPTQKEIRVVANRIKQCHYYLLGIQQCRKQVAYSAWSPESPQHEQGFLPCKKIVDAHYRCLSDNLFGNTLEDVPEYAKEDSENFLNCTFKEFRPMFQCSAFFEGVLRKMIRNEGDKMPIQ